MGVDAQMFVRIPRAVSDEELKRWSYVFGSMCYQHLLLGYEDKILHKPLQRLDLYEQDGDDIHPDHGETFLNVPLSGRYYGKGYERGPLLTYVGIAEFLETLIPECRVWYGGDSSGVCATPFGPLERERLIAHAARVAHDPYEGHFSSLTTDGFNATTCPVCEVAMGRSGWGQNYALFRCSGCGWEVQFRNDTKREGFTLKD